MSANASSARSSGTMMARALSEPTCIGPGKSEPRPALRTKKGTPRASSMEQMVRSSTSESGVSTLTRFIGGTQRLSCGAGRPRRGAPRAHMSSRARGAKQTAPHGPLQRLLESRSTSTKVRAQRSRILITQELVRFGCDGWIDAQQAVVKYSRVHMDVQMRYLLVCRLTNGVPET